MAEHKGKASLKFNNNISIKMTASIVGSTESKSPLKEYFDVVLNDDLAGEDSWEKAEGKILKDTINLLLKKGNVSNTEIDYIFSGDLLNQCSSSNYGVADFNIPYFGVFGACSTFGEAISLASVFMDNNCGKYMIACASSHFCSAEKQFRFPLGLGTQRPPTSTWTVTGAGGVILSREKGYPCIKGITTGRIVDYGITDANNMGSAMVPAAADLIIRNFQDFNVSPSYYDIIITGDLGELGVKLLCEMVAEKGYDISNKVFDCGFEIFNTDELDTHCGGSGCACSATVFSGYIYNMLQAKKINRVLFIPTGALMSSTSVQQGISIAGIAHGIIIENEG